VGPINADHVTLRTTQEDWLIDSVLVKGNFCAENVIVRSRSNFQNHQPNSLLSSSVVSPFRLTL
jgi:hypothetical protein